MLRAYPTLCTGHLKVRDKILCAMVAIAFWFPYLYFWFKKFEGQAYFNSFRSFAPDLRCYIWNSFSFIPNSLKISGMMFFMISKIVTVWDIFMENVVSNAGGQSIQKRPDFYSQTLNVSFIYWKGIVNHKKTVKGWFEVSVDSH